MKRIDEDLYQEWKKKLKDSGFVDIEWGKGRLAGGFLRLGNVKGGNFFENRAQHEEYFRMLGIYAHHCPTCPSKYKDIIAAYAMLGSLPKAVKEVGSRGSYVNIYKYLHKHHEEIMAFVRGFDLQALND